jgi:hypothetical protein
MTDIIFNENDAGELDFLDWQAPDDHLDPEQYPWLQWNNSAARWEFPLEHWGGTKIDTENETVEVVHNFGQDTEPGMLLDCIHISVIAQREVWEGEDEAGKRFYSAVYEKGMRKRYNFLVIVQEAETFDLAVITARSYTGGYIKNAIKQHRSTVLKLASKMAGGTRFPTYMFWLPLIAGEKVYVGSEKKSEIQPPMPIYNDLSALDQQGTIDLVKSLYIGNDLRDAIQEYLFGQGQAWVTEAQQMRLQATNDANAQILPGDVLYLPDLSDKRPPAWINCAAGIPGVFDNRQHASNAFAKLLRDKGLGSALAQQQWEAWREEIERRFNDKAAEREAIETQRMLQNGG